MKPARRTPWCARRTFRVDVDDGGVPSRASARGTRVRYALARVRSRPCILLLGHMHGLQCVRAESRFWNTDGGALEGGFGLCVVRADGRGKLGRKAREEDVDVVG